MKEKTAKIIRVVTVPPVLAVIMLLVLYGYYGRRFAMPVQIFTAIVFLGIIPLLSYPLAYLWKDLLEIREKQRKLAFILNFIGYFGAFVIGNAMNFSKMLRFIFAVYIVTVAVLTFLNKCLHLRASGHAASCAAPCIILSTAIGGGMTKISLLLYCAELWASVKLKRHSISEFLAGGLTAAVAFLFVWTLYGIY